jgi:hypothetical protein
MKDGKEKRRIILDLKESLVTLKSARSNRVVLPRIPDHITNLLDELDIICDQDDPAVSNISDDWEFADVDENIDIGVEQFVLDYTDAFWQVPLHPDERRYFVGMVRGIVLSYLRSAQGSRNGPLSWSVVVSLALRAAQSMFRVSCLPKGDHAATQAERRAEPSLRMQTYVDDPAFSVRGTRPQRDRAYSMVVLLWLSFGFDLAFAKGVRGRTVSWIGVQISVGPTWVRATIKPDRVLELLNMTEKILQGGNVLSIKDMRTYVAKAANFAMLLFAWRPFLGEIWAAVSGKDGGSTGAPTGCLWKKQIAPAVRWISAFLKNEQGTIQRVYTLQGHRGGGAQILICSDACPWGFGSAIFIDGIAVEYFTAQLDEHDCSIFQQKIGDPAGQQAWEALAIVVSLRMWVKYWRRSRVTLEVRSDNITALTMLTSFKGSGHSMSILAREIALDLGCGIFRPDVCSHSPGVAHKVADALSRRFAPEFSYSLPACLQQAAEIAPPSRPRSYYRSLDQKG